MNEVMISVDVASAQLAELVEQIHARGHTVVLTKNGRPLARIVPLPALQTRDELSTYLRWSGVEPPLPAATVPPPLPHETQAPPLAQETRLPPFPYEGPVPPLPREAPVPPRAQRDPPTAPRPHHDAQAAARLRAEAHSYSKKSGPSVQLIFSIGMAVLAGVMVILLVTLIVRSAFAPGPAFKEPQPKLRPAVRDTSRAAPSNGRYLAS